MLEEGGVRQQLKKTLRFLESHQYMKVPGGKACIYCSGWPEDHSPSCQVQRQIRQIKKALKQ